MLTLPTTGPIFSLFYYCMCRCSFSLLAMLSDWSNLAVGFSHLSAALVLSFPIFKFNSGSAWWVTVSPVYNKFELFPQHISPGWKIFFPWAPSKSNTLMNLENSHIKQQDVAHQGKFSKHNTPWLWGLRGCRGRMEPFWPPWLLRLLRGGEVTVFPKDE